MSDYIAIGDIHGMDLLLQRLLAQVPAEGTLVFLGDYIDRGPASREVITRLMALERERMCVFLRGNHEAMALDALAGDNRVDLHWMKNGGAATLKSYQMQLPDDHLAFLARTKPFYETEHYIFVHAGLLPGQRPEDAETKTLWWIRDSFLRSSYDWGKLVIHGHTPTNDGRPDVCPNRINIDTGAVYGSPLTALLLPKQRFIDVPW